MDKTINHSECSKLAQKAYKRRHDRVGKLIHWELCKRLKFDHTNIWYMHKSEYTLKNVMHKFHSDFDVQMHQQIPTRKLINKWKRTHHLVDFAIPADHKVKRLTNRWIFGAKNAVEHEDEGHTNCSGCTWNSFQSPRKEIR